MACGVCMRVCIVLYENGFFFLYCSHYSFCSFFFCLGTFTSSYTIGFTQSIRWGLFVRNRKCLFSVLGIEFINTALFTCLPCLRLSNEPGLKDILLPLVYFFCLKLSMREGLFCLPQWGIRCTILYFTNLCFLFIFFYTAMFSLFCVP